MGCSESHPETVDLPSTAETNVQQAPQADENVEEAAKLLYTSNALSSRVEITLACANLVALDKNSKSDPFVVFYEKGAKGWVEIGRTEVLIDNSNPQFTHHFPYVYRFEEQQILKFDVFDADGYVANAASLDLSKQDYIGSTEVVFANIVSTPCGQVTMPLLKGKDNKRGLITIKTEEMSNQNATVELKFSISDSNLNNGHYYFLQINRMREMGEDACYRTEVVKKEGSVISFKPFSINIQPLCNGDTFRPLLFHIMRWGKNGQHSLSGVCQSCLNSMINNPPVMPLKNKESNIIGNLKIDKCSIIAKPTFLDYIHGGCELNFMVAIDYTGSNGNPAQPGTLHYIDPTGQMNQYEKAIYSIGSVLEYYDTDKKFPVYGFGGVVNGAVNHCFALNFNYQNPEVDGVQGILNIYKSSLMNVGLSGPTLFSGIIDQASNIARTYRPGQKYLILLIITDGIINDMPATIERIIASSSLPMSILIVGVGNADFSNMEYLDGDKHPLVSQTGQKPARLDTVQFVPMREFLNKEPFLLTKALLEELPSQFLQYMKLHNISPNPPPATGNVPVVNYNEPTIPPMQQQPIPINPGVNVVQAPSNPLYPV